MNIYLIDPLCYELFCFQVQELSKMSEGKHLINEWLQEYTTLQDNEIKSFAAEHEHNHEIATAIFNLLYNEDSFSNDPQYEEVRPSSSLEMFFEINF